MEKSRKVLELEGARQVGKTYILINLQKRNIRIIRYCGKMGALIPKREKAFLFAKRNEKLVKLLKDVGEMNLGDVKEHSIDAFGDAYEYLMTMYASNAGK